MANQSNNQQDNNGIIMFFVCIISIALFAVFIWFRFHVGISSALIFIRNIFNWPFYQLYGLWFQSTGIDIPLFRSVIASTTKLCAPSDRYNIFTTCTNDPANITFTQLSIASLPWNIVFCGIAIIIAVIGFVRISENHPKVKFGKKHTLDSFMREQIQNEPHLKVYTDFNLQQINQNEGPLMGMKTPREFATEHKLVTDHKKRQITYISNGVTKSQEDKQELVPTIDRDKLVKILKEQLGGLWVGVEHLTDAETILLAMHLPRACSTDKEMLNEEFYEIKRRQDKLEEEFWEIAANDILWSDKFKPIGFYPDKTCIYPDGNKSLKSYNIPKLKKEFIEPYINRPVAKQLLEKHAYTRTFIIDVIFHARKLGVLAPCQMRWLKFYDRGMWALLQGVGRPSFYCENLGALSHYEAEIISGQKVFQPHFDVAIKGFEFQLQSYQYSNEVLVKMGSKKAIEEAESNNKGFTNRSTEESDEEKG